jgi:hypothetical protein
MQALTDEERKQLCAELRNPYERDFLTFDTAANEIERLSEEVARLKREIISAEKGVAIWSR